jgi:hypothetical protein
MHEQLSDLLISGSLLLVIIGGLTLYLYCIIDIHRHQVKYQSKRMLWLNLVWGLPIIGSILYLMNRKNIWHGPNSSV